MDGNGRWAQSRGMARVKGHERGAETVRTITTFCANHPHIERLTLYAFSTENWKRPKLEVEFLMKLLERWLKNELEVYLAHDVRFEAIGDLSRFSPQLQRTIREVEEATSPCKGLVQSLALNYGSRDEVVRALRRMVERHDPIDEAHLLQALDVAMEVDLLIRTGGDQRLSNFMLLQAAYAELFFTPTLWPDFSTDELQSILTSFETVERRFGGI